MAVTDIKVAGAGQATGIGHAVVAEDAEVGAVEDRGRLLLQTAV